MALGTEVFQRRTPNGVLSEKEKNRQDGCASNQRNPQIRWRQKVQQTCSKNTKICRAEWDSKTRMGSHWKKQKRNIHICSCIRLPP
ncbi:hypothetical protein MHYP_G00227620 [Metynnis hypsauchen]